MMEKDNPKSFKSRAKRILKKRVCLRCNKKFDSTGPGNRICRECHKQETRGPSIRVCQVKTSNGLESE